MKTKLETAREILEDLICNEDLPFVLFTALLTRIEDLDAMPSETCGTCKNLDSEAQV